MSLSSMISSFSSLVSKKSVNRGMNLLPSILTTLASSSADGSVSPIITVQGTSARDVRVQTTTPRVVYSINNNVDVVPVEAGSCWLTGLSLNSGDTTYTSIVLDNITGISGDLSISYNTSLETFSAPVMTYLRGELYIENSPALTLVSCPALIFSDNEIYVNGCLSLETINFESLMIVDDTLVFDSLPLLTSLNLSSLVEVQYTIRFSDCDALASISLPELVKCDGFYVLGCPLITSFSLPSIVTISASFQSDSVTSISWPNLKEITGAFEVMSILTEAQVDSFLALLVGLDGTNGTSLYENQNVYLNNNSSAPPSSAGLASKAILVARGCSVEIVT